MVVLLIKDLYFLMYIEMWIYIYIYTVMGSPVAFVEATGYFCNCNFYVENFQDNPIFRRGFDEISIEIFGESFLRQDLFWVWLCHFMRLNLHSLRRVYKLLYLQNSACHRSMLTMGVETQKTIQKVTIPGWSGWLNHVQQVFAHTFQVYLKEL